MAGRDRTQEFIATVNLRRDKPQYIQKRTEAARPNGEIHQLNRLINDDNYRQFMKLSRECANRLHGCYGKMERLIELAKNRPPFEDNSQELNLLVSEIRKDINEMKGRIDELTKRQNPKQLHSKNIVTTLQQRLADMSNSFKSTLESRSRSIQQHTSRQKQLYKDLVQTPDSSSTSEPFSVLNHRIPYSSINGPSSSVAQNGPSVIDMDGGHYSYDQKQNNYQQQLVGQQQQYVLQNDDSYLTDRANTMQTIESTIVELGTIFNQLATMVQAQDETITRIDTNINETSGNVEMAHDALLRYFASINSNRWLILKVFGILFFFFVVFVIFGG